VSENIANNLDLGALILKIIQRTKIMIIRQATRSDLQDIAAIHIASWKDTYADVMPAEFMMAEIDQALAQHWREIEIQNGDVVLVAKEDALVGFAAVWCRPLPFIDNLHVKPSHRSKKLGSALMKALAKELIKKGHKTAYLWVFESNVNAIRFYERLGGTQTEKIHKNIFGYAVPSRKIEWDDLAKI